MKTLYYHSRDKPDTNSTLHILTTFTLRKRFEKMKTYNNEVAVEIDTTKCSQANHAVASIAGTVTNVFNGKKYTYITIRVTDSNGYCDYKIACNKDSKCKNGDVVSVNCTIKQFYDNDKRSFITAFYEN